MGLVQGLTEFLPISSSGHLVLTEQLFGSRQTDLFFDTVLHLGTLVAVLIVLRHDVRELIVQVVRGLAKIGKPAQLADLFRADPYFRLAVLIVIGTIPAVILGLLFQSVFERLFGSVLAVGIALCVTGLILLTTRYAPAPSKGALKVTWLDSLLIGLAQALAITPGISRSGTTISVALFLKVGRELAGRFSFLLSIPAIGGAALLQFTLPDLWPTGYPVFLAAGFGASAVVGYAALKLLIGLVKKGKFFYFGFYCIPLGIFAIAWSQYGQF